MNRGFDIFMSEKGRSNRVKSKDNKNSRIFMRYH